MKCETCEKNLPAYASGELDPTQAEELRGHLAGCAACREALAFFEKLEESLTMRRLEVPSARRFVRAVWREVGYSRARVVMDVVASLPFLSSFALIASGILFFLQRQRFVQMFEGDYGFSTWIASIAETFNSLVVDFAGGDTLMLSGIYAGATVIVLLTTTLVTLRFIRH